MRVLAFVFGLFIGPAQCSALLGGGVLRGTALQSSESWVGSSASDDDRETQSPMVWLRLHKTVLERTAPSWHDVSFAEEAAERLSEQKATAQPSP